MQTITVWLSSQPRRETDASGALAFLNKVSVCTLHTLKSIYGMVLWDGGVKWKKNLRAWGSCFPGKSSSILTFDSNRTAISKRTHISTWYSAMTRGSGQQQQLLKSSQLGPRSYISYASLWWLTLWGNVLALNVARLKITMEQIRGGCLCVKGKKQGWKIYIHPHFSALCFYYLQRWQHG